MPIPMEYQHASEEFERFLRLVVERTGLTTRNQAYTTAQGVLLTFRRRLEISDAIRFAGALPPVLRAIFVADWDVEEPPRAFSSRAALTEEVRSLRRGHNFSPDSAIVDVAGALRACVDEAEFDRMLATLPPGAAEFWRVAPAGSGFA
ncbi:DUF2267 domain-containing protein [Methylosinus sp. RM1]|uniref:DUF2267 domain-containing protein n=1 Tax=Methylosinus sp. RM1 TaxID=2583817 RepID=UPI001409AF72|nr:DUF2267 domain-containing protein [Methylosinus sp. RM1]